MSLMDRCKHFLKEFPSAHINPTLLRKIYKEHGIKKKNYRWTKQAKGMTAERHFRELTTMKQQLTKAKNSGYRFIYIDETMFSRKSMPTSEWSLPKKNYELDQAHWNEPVLAWLMGISYEKGREYSQIFRKSVDIPKFKEYLQALRNSVGDEKVCIFLDNLKAHKSEESLNEMRRLGFRYVFNVCYAPEYNPIELVFSKLKQRFK